MMKAMIRREGRFAWQRGAIGLGMAAAIALWAALMHAPGAKALEVRFNAQDLRAEDQEAVEAIAEFPESERRAALVVAGHPEELLRIQSLQRDSAAAFGDLIAPYPRDVQEEIWDLVRFPDLAADLARDGRKSESALREIALRYPSEAREAIVKQGSEQYPLWVKIYALEIEAKQDFDSVLHGQSETSRAAFAVVEKRPDLMSLLVENMHMTTVLGSAYRDDPRGVESHFAALEQVVAARKAEQQREWSNELQDPEAAEELRRAAREFAEENGYAYREGYQDGIADERATNNRYDNYSSYAPYPYWFGYPSWYSVAYWYPRPIWGHVGFRFGHNHSFVSIGLPSLFFLDWYHGSYYPRHHARRAFASDYRHAYRTVRYFDQHRPHRSASHRRHVDSIARHVRHDQRRNETLRTESRGERRDRTRDRDERRFDRNDRDGRISRDRSPDRLRSSDRRIENSDRRSPSDRQSAQPDRRRTFERRVERPDRQGSSESRVEKRGSRRDEVRAKPAVRNPAQPKLRNLPPLESGGSAKVFPNNAAAQPSARAERNTSRANTRPADRSSRRPSVSAGPRARSEQPVKRSEMRRREKSSQGTPRVSKRDGPRVKHSAPRASRPAKRGSSAIQGKAQGQSRRGGPRSHGQGGKGQRGNGQRGR